MRIKFNIRFNTVLSRIHLDMAGKFSAAILSIIALLLISSLVAAVELRRMSNNVKDKISDNITCINLSSQMSVALDEYNISLLAIIGKADSLKRWDFDPQPHKQKLDQCMQEINEMKIPNAGNVSFAYDIYYSESLNLDKVIVSDFVDTRDWYFRELQPLYNDFCRELDAMNQAIQDDLQTNSEGFDDSFYRSLMPTIISLLTVSLLCLLLLFYLLVYYVHPLKKMLCGLDAYISRNQPYKNIFEGDDSLQKLNASISEIVDENILLKKRLHNSEH